MKERFLKQEVILNDNILRTHEFDTHLHQHCFSISLLLLSRRQTRWSLDTKKAYNSHKEGVLKPPLDARKY